MTCKKRFEPFIIKAFFRREFISIVFVFNPIGYTIIAIAG